MDVRRPLLLLGLIPLACGSDGASSPGQGGPASPEGGAAEDARAVDGGPFLDGALPLETGGDVTAPLPTGRFRIAMWCGPPANEMTQARVLEIRKAGFTTMSNACDGATYVPSYDSLMLSLAANAGLDVIVSDQRIQDALAGTNAAANLDAVVADYSKSPALAGYFVGDEPSAGSFPAVASVVSWLASRDAAHFAYTNLLPDYASAGQLGTATYDDYVSQFLSTVKPAIFSYDYYPFLTGGADAPTFFADMAVVRARALAAKTPFFQFTQAISYNGHRATTAAEKLWVGTETLAYGGAGVSYFTYWTPPQTTESFGAAIIDSSGNETSQYAEVTAINSTLSAFGKYLVPATSTAVFHNGPLASGTVPRVPGAPVYVPSPAPLTVGIFSVGAGDVYAFLANRDYANPTESDIDLATTAAPPEALDVASGVFTPMMTTGASANGTKVHVSLPPADGLLVHMRGPVPPGALGAEAFVGTVRANTGTLDVVDSSFGDATLRPASWNDCPAGYTLAGRDFQSNGFFLCARNDLLARTFYVGNVVMDVGTLYTITSGAAAIQGSAAWDACPKGKLLGHRFESNGFWLCIE